MVGVLSPSKRNGPRTGRQVKEWNHIIADIVLVTVAACWCEPFVCECCWSWHFGYQNGGLGGNWDGLM